MLTIESDVRCPYRNETIYPFPDMDVGDSFFVRAVPYKLRSVQQMVGQAAKRFGRRSKTRFTTRHVEGGVRCWRVK